MSVSSSRQPQKPNEGRQSRKNDSISGEQKDEITSKDLKIMLLSFFQNNLHIDSYAVKSLVKDYVKRYAEHKNKNKAIKHLTRQLKDCKSDTQIILIHDAVKEAEKGQQETPFSDAIDTLRTKAIQSDIHSNTIMIKYFSNLVTHPPHPVK